MNMSIERSQSSKRSSQVVKHAGLIYLAGQVATSPHGQSVAEQTRDILAKVEQLLAANGSAKSNILSAVIWLADMGDYDEMNEVWDDWTSPGQAPARACVGAQLAGPDYAVEIMITAAI